MDAETEAMRMWTLAQVQAEYRRLDRLLGIDTSRVAVSFSRRMTRQYGVCTFVKNRPQEIRLADFLRREDQVFWDTVRHEYAHAAAAILTGKRHGHDEAWKAVCRRIGCPPERLAPSCEAAAENRRRIEAVRGVRCEYAVGQLMKLGMIRELGRKNVVGRPMLLGTTDAFLRHFGIRSLSELPQLSEIENAEENDNTEDKASN